MSHPHYPRPAAGGWDGDDFPAYSPAVSGMGMNSGALAGGGLRMGMNFSVRRVAAKCPKNDVVYAVRYGVATQIRPEIGALA